MSKTSDIRNVLFYGDNLDVLRRHIADASVDLIYLDPPFNSNADYVSGGVLFAEHDLTKAIAQIKAFEDTWHWDFPAFAGVLYDTRNRTWRVMRIGLSIF